MIPRKVDNPDSSQRGVPCPGHPQQNLQNLSPNAVCQMVNSGHQAVTQKHRKPKWAMRLRAFRDPETLRLKKSRLRRRPAVPAVVAGRPGETLCGPSKQEDGDLMPAPIERSISHAEQEANTFDTNMPSYVFPDTHLFMHTYAGSLTEKNA
ncbi:hypothetical protein DPEC_G00155640 [Dallia pectoralis]|uniref:Uncharacterized protein n=1 Tax=Dallia pectoralis TaxID=75939 RepID=A0ACC2GKI4_DALPE|nr:hypothetical protein DPEC_G00155640 [Dallia pectoralis]